MCPVVIGHCKVEQKRIVACKVVIDKAAKHRRRMRGGLDCSLLKKHVVTKKIGVNSAAPPMPLSIATVATTIDTGNINQ